MTVLLVFVAGAALGALTTWLACTRHYQALRIDRDFQEQDAWTMRDAMFGWWKDQT